MDPDQMAKYWRSLPHQEAAISKAISSLSLSARGEVFRAMLSGLSQDQLAVVTGLWRASAYPPLVCLVASFEGFSHKAYLCPAGVWTIGFGRTTGVKKGDTASPQAEIEWLSHRLRDDSRWVSSQYPMLEKEHEISALTSFVFNVGRAAMSRSTLSRLILQGNTQGAITEFNRWIYGSNKGFPLPGLVHRRGVESALFAFGWNVKKVADQVEIGRRLLESQL